VPLFVSEVSRRKALNLVVENAAVTDSKGKKVDLTEFTKAASSASEPDHAGHDHP
jgi:hypothetical protein